MSTYDMRVTRTVYLTPEQEFEVAGNAGEPLTARVVKRTGDEDRVLVYAYRTYKNGRTTQASHLVHHLTLADLPFGLAAALAS